MGSIGSRGSEGSRGFCSGGSFRFVGSFGFLGSLRLLCPFGLDVRRRRGSSFGALAVFRYAIRPVAAFEARLHSRCSGMIWASVKYPRSTPSRGVSGISCVRRLPVVGSLLPSREQRSACGRCGKPRSVRFSKSRWARSVRPQGRRRPCASSFYVRGTVNRSS